MEQPKNEWTDEIERLRLNNALLIARLEEGNPAKGIIIGLLISLAMWAAIGFWIYY